MQLKSVEDRKEAIVAPGWSVWRAQWKWTGPEEQSLRLGFENYTSLQLLDCKSDWQPLD